MPNRGPASSLGKAIVARNATRHSIFARNPVIVGVESVREWNDHRSAIIAALAPADAVEQSLADRYTDAVWRLRRLRRHEVAVVNAAIDRIPREVDLSRAADRLLRASLNPAAVAAAQASASFLRSLPSLPDDTPVELPEIRRLLAALGRPDAHLMPVDTVHDVRPALEQSAQANGITLEAMLEAFAAAAERAVGLDRPTLEDDERERALRSECRLIPDKDELDRILRYEAHLHRIAMSALHEIEARQARRRGEPTVLARIDAG